MPLSPVQSGLRFAGATFVLGGALNLVAVRQGWAARFDWPAALAVPASVGVLAWGAWSFRAPAPTVVVSRKHILTLMLPPLLLSVVITEVRAHDDRAGSTWLLGAMVVAVAAATAVSRRRRSRTPHTDA